MKKTSIIAISILVIVLIGILLYQGFIAAGVPSINVVATSTNQTSTTTGNTQGGSGAIYSTPSYYASPQGNTDGTISPSQTTITQSDNNSTVHVKIGSRILLELGNMNWTVDVSDKEVIRPVLGVVLIEGAQALYSTNTIGVTTISAEGRPICNPGYMCAQYIVNFSVIVQVDP